MDITETIDSYDCVLVEMHKKQHLDRLISLISKVKNNDYKLGIILVKTPVSELLAGLKKHHVRTEDLFFVDAISVSKEDVKIMDHCIYLSSPDALAEIRTAAKALLEEKEIQILIVDNLSDLGEHNENHEIIDLARSLVRVTQLLRKKIIFNSLKGASKDLVDDISLTCDQSVDF